MLKTDALVQLVHARYLCLTQLRDMGQRQRALLDEGDITSLLDLLSAKQRPLMDLQRIEKALHPFRNEDPEKRLWRTPAERAACAQEIEACERLLREIVGQEKLCETALVAQRDEAAVRLQGFRSAGQAFGAYNAVSQGQMNHVNQIDLSSER